MLIEMEQYWTEFQKDYNVVDENKLEVSEISTKYYVLIPKYTQLLGALEERSTRSLILDHEVNNRYPMEQPVLSNNIKLPRVTVPTFDGSYRKWFQFRDLIIELIHSNKSLGGAQKLMYLKTYLVGDAAKLIHHMQISDDNYFYCWNILTNRFDNKRLQVTVLLDRLIQQPKSGIEC